MTSAEEFKAQGNAALQAGNITQAIECYTKAINTDGTNHVYYSNRSAAYLKQGNASNALSDAESCIALKPDFAKGYSRKGAALHGLKRYNDSIKAYEDGLNKFPGDKGLVSGLEQVKQEKSGGNLRGGGMPGMGMGGMPGMGGGANPMASLFGPDLIARIAMDPKLRVYLDDADFMSKLKLLQSDPNQISSMLGDKRIMEVFQMILGGAGMGMKGGPFGDDDMKTEEKSGGDSCCPPGATTCNASKPAAAPKPAPKVEVEEEESSDDEDYTPEELKKRVDQKKAVEAKLKGNDYYKNKKYDEALAAYDEAAALDPTNMTFTANKAAVYFSQKDYDACIDTCLKAFEIGKDNRAPFEERAKVLTRCGRAYHKKGDIATAITKLQDAQLESFNKDTQRLLKNWELDKRKADTLAYQNDDLAEEAKQRGNEHFRSKNWVDAVKEYEEAIKRAPKNAAIRNNLAAALCKIMDFNGAKREIDVALDLDPQYVKAWVQKGNVEVLMKENHKAMESYRKGLALDPNNAACKQGLQKVQSMMMNNTNMSEEERKERAEHALADPEIQSILQDPIIRQILQDLQENPQTAQQAMMDPTVRAKIEKLIASGILQTG